MPTIGSFKIKVFRATDKKTLSDGSQKDYEYGVASVRSTILNKYIGKDVIVKILDLRKQKKAE